MNVLIVTPYASFNGGVESVNAMLRSVLEADGHNVSLLTADDEGGARSVVRRLVGLPAVTSARFRKLDPRDYDMVIANGEFAWGIDHPNVLCVFHGSYLGFRDHLRAHLSRRQYWSLSWHAFVQQRAAKGRKVVAVSGFLAEILKRQGIEVSRVIVNGIDTQQFRPVHDRARSRYLFVGSYHRYGKGFDILESLARRGLPIDCVTNADPGVDLGYLGVVDRERMPDVYRRYRLVIFPSRFESVGLVPLEAMSCGTPVVMSNVGVGPELRCHLPAFVFDQSGENVADDILRRIADIENDYDYYASAARRYVTENHSWERFSSQWRECVRERIAC
ncbi:glycosyltransferase involved in cell wall biosynthesis [Povalibacter uvarum]|uniref:Glycosyltransferase involved in cell wall biosynthesis n=1 Tax=Povalibacter uvarum TaxID=732238 RepID=A0A841HGP5_9GAMM|nr:glycosyltransferase family 4 protein [Povalibacter uvarum]MBB6091255.1 glycosyltransferase involved in cell wall biosynthesis [Povalibacter uvarum]